MSDHAFYVHWNKIHHCVRIHRAACGCCKNGAGMHPWKMATGRTSYGWIAADTYPEARAIAAASPAARAGAAVKDCLTCRPSALKAAAA